MIIGFSLAGFRAFGVIKGLVQGVSGLLREIRDLYQVWVRIGFRFLGVIIGFQQGSGLLGLFVN